MKLGRILTIILVVLIASTAVVLGIGYYQQVQAAYQSNLKYSFSRIVLQFDYSCDTNVTGLYLSLTNAGTKVVQDLNIQITNPLCVGAVPPLPSSLNASQTIKMYLYTTVPNGTITVTGNNTVLSIKF